MIYLLNEDGNAALKNTKFYLTDKMREYLQNTLENFKNIRSDFNVEGYKRLNNLLNMDGIEYNEMKRLKNFFDNYIGNGEDDAFKLNGGYPMKNWVDNTLRVATKRARDQKQALEFERGSKNQVKPKQKSERNTTSKVVQAPTKMTISFSNTPTKVNNNEIVKFDSLVKSPKINEQRIIKISDSQLKTLKK